MNCSLISKLYEIEHQINLEKCWLNILCEHCEFSEYNTDTELGLIITEINTKNSNIFNNLELIIEHILKKNNL